MTELINANNALIDQVQIYSVPVLEIKDPDMLIKNNIMFSKKDAKSYYLTRSGQEFSHLQIEDAEYGFVFCANRSVQDINYEKLIINVNDKTYKNLNCMSCQDLMYRIAEIKKKLESEYGVVIDTQEACVSQIEINKTIALQYNFYTYARTILRIFGNFPRQLRFNEDQRFDDYNKCR